ncbi:Transcriptional regulator, AraC family [Fulvivirga imtechensis AK7]|uniref:Transcriptional regulator, AraC family n=1 Tax=Fulvivirga imtechensis AK7 TaxID=1237149 RepID=L8JNS3_9BACT|nr:AraC family transcriptional regulator [Fulvivirga imtechensis]ELR70495.1 Transcriptional regulator, AraC family [Fulvivirga imtechensis AK7]
MPEDLKTYPRIYLYRRVVQAKLFIDSHYAADIDLNNVSGEAHLSKFHFIRQFKKIYGETPHQYLKRVRIEKAQLLLTSGIPVSETCYLVGFESLSSFSGLFKRLTGITPSEYMRQQQKLKSQIRSQPLQFIPGCFAKKKGWYTDH